MTREEAAKIIADYDVNGCGYCHQGGDEVPEAFSMAIEALKAQEPIPVEWLRHRLTMAQKNGSAHPEQAIRYVLWLWEQQKDGEQEVE